LQFALFNWLVAGVTEGTSPSMSAAAKLARSAAAPPAAAAHTVPTPARHRAAGQQPGEILLRGSAETVAEFFGYAFNSIIYLRGIHPEDAKFKPIQKYGLTIQVTSDPRLEHYLSKVLQQLRQWLFKSHVQKLVLVVSSKLTDETLERWTFNIQVCNKVASGAPVPPTHADVTRCQKEIQAILRQLTVSVTCLPLLQEDCDFDILVHTDKQAEVPVAWGETGQKLIAGESQEIPLQSFNTKLHTVGGSVSYKDDC